MRNEQRPCTRYVVDCKKVEFADQLATRYELHRVPIWLGKSSKWVGEPDYNDYNDYIDYNDYKFNIFHNCQQLGQFFSSFNSFSICWWLGHPLQAVDIRVRIFNKLYWVGIFTRQDHIIQASTKAVSVWVKKWQMRQGIDGTWVWWKQGASGNI